MRELQLELLKLDPHNVVKSSLDSFHPYSYIEVPPFIRDKVQRDDMDEWDNFLNTLLERLVDEGTSGWRL